MICCIGSKPGLDTVLVPVIQDTDYSSPLLTERDVSDGMVDSLVRSCGMDGESDLPDDVTHRLDFKVLSLEGWVDEGCRR